MDKLNRNTQSHYGAACILVPALISSSLLEVGIFIFSLFNDYATTTEEQSALFAQMNFLKVLDTHITNSLFLSMLAFFKYFWLLLLLNTIISLLLMYREKWPKMFTPRSVLQSMVISLISLVGVAISLVFLKGIVFGILNFIL